MLLYLANRVSVYWRFDLGTFKIDSVNAGESNSHIFFLFYLFFLNLIYITCNTFILLFLLHRYVLIDISSIFKIRIIWLSV